MFIFTVPGTSKVWGFPRKKWISIYVQYLDYNIYHNQYNVQNLNNSNSTLIYCSV